MSLPGDLFRLLDVADGHKVRPYAAVAIAGLTRNLVAHYRYGRGVEDAAPYGVIVIAGLTRNLIIHYRNGRHGMEAVPYGVFIALCIV